MYNKLLKEMESVDPSLNEAKLKKALDMHTAAAKKKTFPEGTKVSVRHERDTSSGDEHLVLSTQDGVTYTRILKMDQKSEYLA